MKKILSSFVLFLLLIAMVQTGVSSCRKEKTFYDTVTVVQKDTVLIKDTTVSLTLLTANSWKMQEIEGVQGNAIVSYKRGATGNTESFDNEYITFNPNKTGIYVDETGYAHQLTWDFLNSAQTKLTFTLENPAPLATQTIVYDNLRYENGALLFDQNWTYDNVNSYAQLVRIPK